ncbi:MAG: electron transporter RnfD [Lachnospiraceae bacterium]|nr:electron transporter RnfD [Lachnospiraceae bacterium]
MLLSEFNTSNYQFVSPALEQLLYTGRIDFSNAQAPCFIFAGSSVAFRFRGTSVQMALKNYHSCYHNYVGVVIDGTVQEKIEIPVHNEDIILTVAEGLADTEHEIILYKCQDASHYYDFLGLYLEPAATLLASPARPVRRMECYGDSVSAGEVSEALDYVGKQDPEGHDGIYSNAWHSYAFITARKLGAELHDIAQGGIALFDKTGYFHGPDYVGLETTWDKLRYCDYFGELTPWDFSLYTPHVVLVAIGQNDANPENYMGHDETKSRHWMEHYKALILKLRAKYPNALFVLATTILCHDKAWDDAIETVTKELNDPKIVHFLYSNNGCGTPGHIRKPEAEQMAEELSAFIEGFGEEIWK